VPADLALSITIPLPIPCTSRVFGTGARLLDGVGCGADLPGSSASFGIQHGALVVEALTRFAALTRARETAPIPARSEADRPAPAGWAALRLLADVDISFSRNCCWQFRGRTMELGRSAPMLMSASPGRGGGDGAGAGPSAASYRVIDNDRQIPQHRQWGAEPCSFTRSLTQQWSEVKTLRYHVATTTESASDMPLSAANVEKGNTRLAPLTCPSRRVGPRRGFRRVLRLVAGRRRERS
jgi:hypothetical protein